VIHKNWFHNKKEQRFLQRNFIKLPMLDPTLNSVITSQRSTNWCYSSWCITWLNTSLAFWTSHQDWHLALGVLKKPRLHILSVKTSQKFQAWITTKQVTSKPTVSHQPVTLTLLEAVAEQTFVSTTTIGIPRLTVSTSSPIDDGAAMAPAPSASAAVAAVDAVRRNCAESASSGLTYSWNCCRTETQQKNADRIYGTETLVLTTSAG